MSPWAVACLLGVLKFYVYASPVSSSISGLIPTTASNPSMSLTTLGTALPTCIQPRASTDPPAAQISSSLASASIVQKSCNRTTDSVARVGAVQIVYYNSGAYYLNITRLASLHLPVVPASYCPQQFQKIIDTCVVQQSFWGGWITNYGVNWSVSNFDYPQNPLPLPPSSSGASGTTASTVPPQQGTYPRGSPVSTGTGTTSPSNSEAESAGSETKSTSGGVLATPSGSDLTTTQSFSTESTKVAVGSTSTAVASNSATLHTNGTLQPGVFPAKNTVSTTLSQAGVSKSAATTSPAAPSGVLIGAGGITQLTGPTTITPDYSITNAFPSGVSTTTLSASNGAVLVYSMQTFADLTTLTGGPILVQTSVTQTESDGHHTVFIGGVWVGSGGRYWGPPGLPKVEAPGINLPKISPPCIWPFCSGRITDDGEGGGDPGGDPPQAHDPNPDDPENQSEQNESQRNSETEEKTSMASTGTSATTSRSSLSNSVSTITSISSSTPSSMSTSTISSSSLSSNRSSSSSSTSSSSSYPMNRTVMLPDQGYVYTTMELSDAMSWSAAVQSCLTGLVIPTAPFWAPTDSAESAEQAHATDSFSFYIALPPGSLTAEPSGTSQAANKSTSATQTLATPTTSSIAVARSSPASTTAPAPAPSPPSSPSPSPLPLPSPSPPSPSPSPPPPTPSLAIIIWRQDDCSDILCESEARVFDIAAGAQSSVNPCTDGTVDYSYQFAADVANDNSDYTIAFGKFTTHNIEDVSYAGSNLHVGRLTGAGLPGGSVQCEIPQPVATSCSSSHSLDADDQTPIAYCAW